MIILGLHFGHDGSACVVKNGKLVSAISTERITRVKKESGLTNEVIDYVLDAAGITIDDVDHIALAEYLKDFSNGTVDLINNDGTRVESTIATLYFNETSSFQSNIRGRTIPTTVISHHLAHCASAYYTSNFDSAWCLSMDTSHHLLPCNSLVAKGEGNKLVAMYCPNIMVGIGYYVFTLQLGLGSPMYKAGTTMGLASYGTPLAHVVENIDQYVDETFFPDNINPMQYVEYFYGLWNSLSGGKTFSGRDSYLPEATNLAATMQYIFEKSLLRCANNIPAAGDKNLCLGGGSLYNCNANTILKTESQFENVHHFPACGDDGLCVGAALYVAHHVYNEPRYNYKSAEVCYLGKAYDYVEPDYETIAKMIADGKIIAWFMGKSEYGPRALGNRSILADPRTFHNREKINFIIKNREWFRPFAPVVLEEESEKWFDFKGPSPFMLYTAQVLQPKEIPAVTHVDNTARMQTVNEEQNPPYYRLVKEFFKLTDVPILINTSLNGKDEPILETEEDAMRFFQNTNVDAMVLNGRLFIRATGSYS